MSDPKTLFIAGPPPFVQSYKELQEENITLVGEAFSPEDVYTQMDALQPWGVLLPAGEEWIELAFILAEARKNILFFVAGAVDKATWDRLNDVKILVVSADPSKALPSISAALQRVGTTTFLYEQKTPVIASSEIISHKNIEVLQECVNVFYSVKGGSGKTTLASNTAATVGLWAKDLRKQQDKEFRVALLDFNSDYGSAKYSFGFSPFGKKKPRTSLDFEDLNLQSSLSAVLDRMNYHEHSNLYFLAPPQNPYQRNAFTGAIARKTLDILRKHFHFIFIDLGVAVDKRDAAIEALDRATSIVVVLDTDPDTSVLMHEQLQEFKLLVHDFTRVRLMVNKIKSGSYLPAEAAKLLGLPLMCQVPYSPLLEKSKGKGMPAVCLNCQDPFSIEIARAARGLLGTRAIEFPAVPRKSGFWSRIPFLKKISL